MNSTSLIQLDYNCEEEFVKHHLEVASFDRFHDTLCQLGSEDDALLWNVKVRAILYTTLHLGSLDKTIWAM